MSVYTRGEKFTRPQTAPTLAAWLPSTEKLQPVPEEEV
jgi:hypothetical protein